MAAAFETLSRSYSESANYQHDRLMKLCREAEFAASVQDLIDQGVEIQKLFEAEIERLESWMTINYDFADEGRSIENSAKLVLRTSYGVGELVAECKRLGHELTGAEILDQVASAARELWSLSRSIQLPYDQRAEAVATVRAFDSTVSKDRSKDERPPQAWYDEEFVQSSGCIPVS